MKIKVIIPNSSKEFLKEQTTQRKKVAMKGVSVDVVCLPKGPVSLESAVDEAYGAPYLLTEIHKAEQEGYDAITIDCACDPLLRACKEASTIPIVSAGEASRLLALALGEKFSVITVLSNTADVIKDIIAQTHLDARVASIRATEIPVLELKNYQATKIAILKESKIALEKDGADVIVLGCTGMAKLARDLQEELKVPVIEPATAAIKIAELLVQMNLTHSKKCYKNTPLKEIK